MNLLGGVGGDILGIGSLKTLYLELRTSVYMCVCVCLFFLLSIDYTFSKGRFLVLFILFTALFLALRIVPGT